MANNAKAMAMIPAGNPVAGRVVVDPADPVDPESPTVRAAGAAVGAFAAKGQTPFVTRRTENPPLPSACQISARSGMNVGASIAYELGGSLGPVPSSGLLK